LSTLIRRRKKDLGAILRALSGSMIEIMPAKQLDTFDQYEAQISATLAACRSNGCRLSRPWRFLAWRLGRRLASRPWTADCPRYAQRGHGEAAGSLAVCGRSKHLASAERLARLGVGTGVLFVGRLRN
jgi:hypothetical protein